MKPVNKPFVYHSAAETANPGYLRRRFQEIAKRQKEQPSAEVITPQKFILKSAGK